MKRSLFRATTLAFLWTLLNGIFSPTYVPPARAEFFSDDYDLARVLDLILGESKVIPVVKPKRIAIGDPAVADVAGASAKEIIIAGKKPGETNLQIWDEYGQREITVRVYAEDLGKLKNRLEDLFKTAGVRGVTFQVGTQERKIFALGELPLRKKEVVNQLLASFSGKLINLITYKEDNPLVEIDAQVMEINKTLIDKLGIDWSQSASFTEAAQVGSHSFQRTVTDFIQALGISRFSRSSLTATLSMLEQDNLARVLERPKLVALSGKEARFLVGGQVPILSNVSVSSGTTTTSVQYVDYGIKLNIRPEVQENGNIMLRLEIEIRSIDQSTSLSVQTGAGASTSTPGFKARTVSSELYLKNEQTLFLAGLIDNNQANNLSQMPGLGNLPIIGALFRSKNFQNGATELVVSLTPRILNYGDLASDMQAGAVTAGAGSDAGDPADGYMRRIQDIILKNVSYPLEAQRSNLSGAVTVSLHLASTGQLMNVMVNESSGHQLLDKAAVYTVKRMAPYPAFPKDLMLKEIWVEVPITYQLN